MRLFPSFCLLLIAVPALRADDASTERLAIEPGSVHLRSGNTQEWSEFPADPKRRQLDVSFAASRNATESTLLVRQQDVKQVWNVSLNGKKLGELVRDENDMVVAFAIPTGTLVDADNSLQIAPASTSDPLSDDIRVGQIAVLNRSVAKVLSESSLDVTITDADSNKPLPCRVTIVNEAGALQSLGNQSNDHLAVRPGMAYTSTGHANLKLPSGRYTVFAGRGFEYSIARTEVTVGAGETVTKTLAIRREVPTEGYVACDTHVHTLTHSGHGDATIDERMITIAGEGIELPIATDHNKYIDYEATAAKMHVRRYFTPVVGNEVTTPRGHFNIFPVAAGARVVDHTQTDWRLLFDEIQQTPGVQIAILNHARDLHSGVRPFGPAHFNASVGENLDSWPLRFNAMEVVNSGAVQSDPLRLFRDWMGLLNRGLSITPVGSSDSHDVGRYLIGQGRTYIRCDDHDPGNIAIDSAVENFVQGRVMVSYGLLTEMAVNNRFRCGDTATDLGEQIQIEVRVLGPHWTAADRVQLFSNGSVIREAAIPSSTDAKQPPGTKWIGGWTIPKPNHDVHLVAIATGPGVDGLYWRTAKPYQPTSPDWNARTIGCSGVVWLDVDKDGRKTSARAYAEGLVTAAGGDWMKLFASLSTYDEAVAAQCVHLVRTSGTPLTNESLLSTLKSGTLATQSGFQSYAESWRENEIARSELR